MTIGNAIAIQNVIDEKQDVLVSGTTIKTINGTSVLGSGDIVISGGSGGSVDSVNGYTGAVTLTKSDVGLGNVDNTSDANKPVSTAQQTALDLKSNLAGGNTFSGNQICGTTTLTYSSTYDLDLSLNANFEITLTGNITFRNPSATTPIKGQIGTITATQDAIGGRTIAWGTNFKFEGGNAPTYVTTANSISTFVYFVRSPTSIVLIPIVDWK